MEEDSIPLNQLLEYYEKGNDLLQQCENSLAEARKQLQTIKDKASNSPANKAPAADQDNDDIELF